MSDSFSLIIERARDLVFRSNLKHISKCSVVEKNRKFVLNS